MPRLIADKRNNHAVEVEEEHDEVEAELEEGLLQYTSVLSYYFSDGTRVAAYLLMHVQLAEDLRGIQQMGVVNDLVDIVSQERQVEDESDPVAIDQEQEGEEAVNGGFGDDVCV